MALSSPQVQYIASAIPFDVYVKSLSEFGKLSPSEHLNVVKQIEAYLNISNIGSKSAKSAKLGLFSCWKTLLKIQKTADSKDLQQIFQCIIDLMSRNEFSAESLGVFYDKKNSSWGIDSKSLEEIKLFKELLDETLNLVITILSKPGPRDGPHAQFFSQTLAYSFFCYTEIPPLVAKVLLAKDKFEDVELDSDIQTLIIIEANDLKQQNFLGAKSARNNINNNKSRTNSFNAKLKSFLTSHGSSSPAIEAKGHHSKATDQTPSTTSHDPPTLSTSPSPLASHQDQSPSNISPSSTSHTPSPHTSKSKFSFLKDLKKHKTLDEDELEQTPPQDAFPGIALRTVDSSPAQTFSPPAEPKMGDDTSLNLDNQSSTLQETLIRPQSWRCRVNYLGLASALSTLQCSVNFQREVWVTNLFKREDNYFGFVEKLVAQAISLVGEVKAVEWKSVPCFYQILRKILATVKKKVLFQDLQKLPTPSLFRNPYLLNLFVKYSFCKTSVHNINVVYDTLKLLTLWIKDGAHGESYIVPKFDIDYFLKGLDILFDSEHFGVLMELQIFLFTIFDYLDPLHRIRITNSLLLEKYFMKMFFHWNEQVNNIFMYILLFRVKHLKADLSSGSHTKLDWIISRIEKELAANIPSSPKNGNTFIPQNLLVYADGSMKNYLSTLEAYESWKADVGTLSEITNFPNLRERFIRNMLPG